MIDDITEARARFATLETDRAKGLQAFKAAQADLQKANAAVKNADDIYRAAGNAIKKAREELESAEAFSMSALKALMEAERR